MDLKISTENIIENVKRSETEITVFALDSDSELRAKYFQAFYHGCDNSCPPYKQKNKIHRGLDYGRMTILANLKNYMGGFVDVIRGAATVVATTVK